MFRPFSSSWTRAWSAICAAAAVCAFLSALSALVAACLVAWSAFSSSAMVSAVFDRGVNGAGVMLSSLSF